MGATAPVLDWCPVCGAKEFTRKPILWPELIEEWKLSSEEADHIDLQQGFSCTNCKNNLRAMTLAAAITKTFGFEGSFKIFCSNTVRIRDSIVIEINAAGQAFALPATVAETQAILLSGDRYSANGFHDRINRCDYSLGHSGARSRFEGCFARILRVLKRGGRLFYTIPIVIGRLTRSRHQLPPSHHGNPAMTRDDLRVQTEYGADFGAKFLKLAFASLA